MKNKYLYATKNLSVRNKNRLNSKSNPIEVETDKLFYWIISQLELSMENCYPPQTYHSVTIKISRKLNDGHILLTHGRISEYLSEYSYSNNNSGFFAIMLNVSNIFNLIGDGKDYAFYSNCIIPESKIESAEITVSMTTKV